ncbi:hypothetical protein ABKN59_000250 [Abortiporus biennis]
MVIGFLGCVSRGMYCGLYRPSLRPLWVTEWACQNYNQVDQQYWVERYAWFGAMEDMQGVNQDDALIDTHGNIDTLGNQYISAITPNVSANYNPRSSSRRIWYKARTRCH